VRKTSKFRRWYECCKRAVRELRYMCVSLLTIVMAVAGVIELVAKLYSTWAV